MNGHSYALRFARFGLAFAAAIAIASSSGCSLWPTQAPSPKTADARGGVGLPAEGASVCLQSDGTQAALDVLLRSAVVDRGYRVVMTDAAASTSGEACRFFLVLRASRAKMGEMPASISLEFRDVYTGEAQRAQWRRDKLAVPAYMRAAYVADDRRGVSDAGSNALIAGPYGDPAMIVRSLVDQLFPAPVNHW